MDAEEVDAEEVEEEVDAEEVEEEVDAEEVDADAEEVEEEVDADAEEVDADTEEVDAEEEDFVEVEYEGQTYCTNNETHGKLYMLSADGEIGEQVGYLVEGKVHML